ncbi:hypothetical protein [Streptomyces mirabilis]|uniref:hypothetical protein n=1 Tax=Streptomyces mirabilis TaxID=68239 RepID=UPI0037FDDE8B
MRRTATFRAPDAAPRRSGSGHGRTRPRRPVVGLADDWRTATGVVLDESLAVKHMALGFSLVEFDTQVRVGAPMRP